MKLFLAEFCLIIMLSYSETELSIKEPTANQKPILSQSFEMVDFEEMFKKACKPPSPKQKESRKQPPIPKPFNSMVTTFLISNGITIQHEFHYARRLLIADFSSSVSSLNVHVGFYVESLGSLDVEKMTYDMDIFFLTSWKDPSLAHKDGLKVINDKHALPYTWKPDLYFANARQGLFQYTTVPNFVMYIYEDGTIAFSIRVTLNVACNLRLELYPMDTQTCSLKIMSYAHTHQDMVVKWFSKKPVGYNRNISLPQFTITSLKPVYCDGNHKYAMTEDFGWKRADFSCLRAEIYLRRSIGHHLVQTYIPTGLIVAISWVSFWIDRSAIAARVSLAFSTILTLSTMVVGISFNLPPVSYVKAIDIWFAFCILFVFLALVEFAMVNSLMRSAYRYHELGVGGNNRRRKSVAKHVDEIRQCMYKKRESFDDELNGVRHPTEIFIQKSDRHSSLAMSVDHWSRILFPVSFFLLSAFYWLYYAVLAHIE